MIITVEISDHDAAIMHTDIVDIQNWLQTALTGKVNNCRLRFNEVWWLIASNTPSSFDLAGDTMAFEVSVLNHPLYMNRAAKDTKLE